MQQRRTGLRAYSLEPKRLAPNPAGRTTTCAIEWMTADGLVSHRRHWPIPTRLYQSKANDPRPLTSAKRYHRELSL